MTQGPPVVVDLSVPCSLSSTSISSNFTPGLRTRRTAATSTSLPTARTYSLSSAPPYSVSQLSSRGVPVPFQAVQVITYRMEGVLPCRISQDGDEKIFGGTETKLTIDPEPQSINCSVIQQLRRMTILGPKRRSANMSCDSVISSWLKARRILIWELATMAFFSFRTNPSAGRVASGVALIFSPPP